MKTVTVSQLVRAPVDRVFALYSDLKNLDQYVAGIERVEVLTDGPFGVGTRWKETRVMFGKEASEVMEITACEPPREYVAEAESHGMHYRTVWRFEPQGRETRVTMEFTGKPLSIGAKLMSPLTGVMLKSVKRLIMADMDSIAAVAETSQQ